MNLPEMKTAAALAGGVVGLAILANGCYFIDSIGKPLIFTGVIVTLSSVAYIILYARKMQNTAQITPDPTEPSYV